MILKTIKNIYCTFSKKYLCSQLILVELLNHYVLVIKHKSVELWVDKAGSPRGSPEGY